MKKSIALLLTAVLLFASVVSTFAVQAGAKSVEPDELLATFDVNTGAVYAGATHTILTRIGENKTIAEITGYLDASRDYNYFYVYAAEADTNGNYVITAEYEVLGRPDGVKSDVEVPENGFLVCLHAGDEAAAPMNEKINVGDIVVLENVDLEALSALQPGENPIAGTGKASFYTAKEVEEEPTPEQPKVEPDELIAAFGVNTGAVYAGATHTILARIGENKTISEITGYLDASRDYNYFYVYAAEADANGNYVITAEYEVLGRPDGVKSDVEVPENGFLVCLHAGDEAAAPMNEKINVGDIVVLENVDLAALAALQPGENPIAGTGKASFYTAKEVEEPTEPDDGSLKVHFTQAANSRTVDSSVTLFPAGIEDRYVASDEANIRWSYAMVIGADGTVISVGQNLLSDAQDPNNNFAYHGITVPAGGFGIVFHGGDGENTFGNPELKAYFFDLLAAAGYDSGAAGNTVVDVSKAGWQAAGLTTEGGDYGFGYVSFYKGAAPSTGNTETVVEEIAVDGKLDDTGWVKASWNTYTLWQNASAARPEDRTAMTAVRADADNIYLAFVVDGTIAPNIQDDYAEKVAGGLTANGAMTSTYNQTGATSFRLWLRTTDTERYLIDVQYLGEELGWVATRAIYPTGSTLTWDDLAGLIDIAVVYADGTVTAEFAIDKAAFGVEDDFRMFFSYWDTYVDLVDDVNTDAYQVIHVCSENTQFNDKGVIVNYSGNDHLDAYISFAGDEVELGTYEVDEGEEPLPDPKPAGNVNVALGKEVTIKKATAIPQYSNANLTDGKIATTMGWGNPDDEWFSFYYNVNFADQVNIDRVEINGTVMNVGNLVIDLADYYAVGSFKIHYNKDYIPETTNIYVSADGVKYTKLIEKATTAADGEVDGAGCWIEFSLDEVAAAQYVKVEFVFSGMFAMLDEVEVYSVEAEEEPEEPEEPEIPGELIVTYEVNSGAIYATGSHTVLASVAGNTTIVDITNYLLGGTGGKDYNYFFVYAVEKGEDGNYVVTAEYETLGRPDGVKNDIAVPENGYLVCLSASGIEAMAEQLNVGNVVVFEGFDPADLATLEPNQNIEGAKVSFYAVEEDPGEEDPECKHENTTTTTVDPTCTEDGFTKEVCDDCGEEISREILPALGHDYVDGVCTRCGAEDPDYTAPEEPKKGDLNDDDVVDAEDYMLLKRFVLGTYDLNEEQQALADINGDGVVDAEDYMLLKRFVLGTYEIK